MGNQMVKKVQGYKVSGVNREGKWRPRVRRGKEIDRKRQKISLHHQIGIHKKQSVQQTEYDLNKSFKELIITCGVE